ncbi:SAM-dependent methyltransferase [Thermomonospora catenispora]|uniref:SAM-dependent methyltransferase n=1 Tax=Thermomonospora catenispora TaxID=2493090 RepID=UPI00111F5461|nr:SAM-dependent methyltransferase [Thermomonospora catenispora]TNY37101.1 SAM-dependent methyltransferase [Thermomonospora catenispora]
MTGSGSRAGGFGFDPTVPNIARMYDYYLGGKDNYEADRRRAHEAMQADPTLLTCIRENRAFLGRAVRFLAEQGIDQFLDIGTGLPTQQNVHQIAQSVNPRARVVYVDNDDQVVAHARALLASDTETTTIVHADLRRPGEILEHPETRRLLDFDKPIGMLVVATLHFVPDSDDPWGVMAELRNALAPGSHLALTHASADGMPDLVAKVVEVYRKTNAPGTPRTAEQVTALFGDFELLEPGLVWAPLWRPERPVTPEEAIRTWFYAGVGRKP